MVTYFSSQVIKVNLQFITLVSCIYFLATDMVFNALWSIEGLSTIISGYILIINFDLQHITVLNFQRQAVTCT